MTRVRIIKKADDPGGLSRVQVGAGPQFGFVYCAYRGTREAAIECLEIALGELREQRDTMGTREPDVAPETNGKRYA